MTISQVATSQMRNVQSGKFPKADLGICSLGICTFGKLPLGKIPFEKSLSSSKKKQSFLDTFRRENILCELLDTEERYVADIHSILVGYRYIIIIIIIIIFIYLMINHFITSMSFSIIKIYLLNFHNFNESILFSLLNGCYSYHKNLFYLLLQLFYFFHIFGHYDYFKYLNT